MKRILALIVLALLASACTPRFTIGTALRLSSPVHTLTLAPETILVGDSVSAITLGYPGHLLVPLRVDALGGRSMFDHTTDNGTIAVRKLYEAGHHGQWVIELGLNDLAKATHDPAILAGRVEAVVAETHTPASSVIWVVPYVDPTAPYGTGNFQRAVLASYVPDLEQALALAGVTHLVRWDQVGVPTDTYDGVHPTADGAVHYSNLVRYIPH